MSINYQEINEKNFLKITSSILMFFQFNNKEKIDSYYENFLYRMTYEILKKYPNIILEKKFEDIWNDSNNKEELKKEARELAWKNNFWDLTTKNLKNPLWIILCLEKKAFQDNWNPIVKKILENKKTKNSIYFYEILANIQTSYLEDEIDSYDLFFWKLTENIDKMDKAEINELANMHLDALLDIGKDVFVQHIVSNINWLQEHTRYVNLLREKIEKHQIDINEYSIQVHGLPTSDQRFFISSSFFGSINNLLDFGFSFKNYRYKEFNFLDSIVYDETINNVALNFYRRILNDKLEPYLKDYKDSKFLKDEYFIKNHLLSNELKILKKKLEYINLDESLSKKYENKNKFKV